MVRGSGWHNHPEPTTPTPDACLRTVHRCAASPSVHHNQRTMTNSPPKQSINPPPTLGRAGRAVGLDIHPDSFAAAILQGRDPLNARVVHSVTRQPLAGLGAWAVAEAHRSRLACPARPLEQSPGRNHHAPDQAHQAGHRARRPHAPGTRLRQQGRLPGAEIGGAAHASLGWGTTVPQTPPLGGTEAPLPQHPRKTHQKPMT